jgi:putative transposase
MARLARTKSESGIYHVIVRGINRQNIFQDDEDESVYLKRLTQYMRECGIELYAYCLMSNHVHLLLNEGDTAISEFMKKLGISYSYWFNRKYDRVGHLFQDRYKSEAVNDDSYFLTVFRYIHRNPQKAGLKPFIRTSYMDYAEQGGITDTTFALSLFSSQAELLDYLNKDDSEKCMETEEERRLTDGKAAELICRIGNVNHSLELQNIDGENRNRIIRELKAAGLSIRQIERLAGINRGIVARV